MAVHLYLAPAAAGKTSYMLERTRQAAQALRCTPRVCLPTSLQVRSWHRRLAEAGGAIGVRLLTFDHLYAECLRLSGQVYTELSEPVQYRLLRVIAEEAELQHYAPLVDRPGFIQVVRGLIAELKGAQIYPEAFEQAVTDLGSEPRLRELAQLYSAYQKRLQAYGWADRAGMGWLAVAVLREDSQIASGWPLLIVDGFDSFTPVQIALLQLLAERVGETILSLTGEVEQGEHRAVHQRFAKTRRRLEQALGVAAEPLPEQRPPTDPLLAQLESNLFRSSVSRVEAGGTLEMVAALDRAAEARTALRWLKRCLLEEGMRPGEVALLARAVGPYRPFVQQTAAEFGLPIRLRDGLSLRTNPAVATLLNLLRLMLPSPGGGEQPSLPRRLVLEAWSSPYLDWSALPAEDVPIPIGIAPGDANALDAAARWGRVLGGQSQWEETLQALAGRSAQEGDDPEEDLPAGVPCGEAAQELLGKFCRFVQRLTPSQGNQHVRDWVRWLESLIGPDEPADAAAHRKGRAGAQPEPAALHVVARARRASPAAEQDVAALQALKDILRGLVWAEEALQSDERIDFPGFFSELSGTVEATTYHLPLAPGREEILVADTVQARGVPFRAAAVLGLAEGELPATLTEDAFLRDADRAQLRERFELPLESSTESAEIEFFYETITRPWERLLLTRPRLADNGAPWQASPYWEEILRLVRIEPQTLSGESIPLPAEASSWSELLESLVRYPAQQPLKEWVRRQEPARWAALETAAYLLSLREGCPQSSPFDGDLQALSAEFQQRFGPEHIWSPSRLENYRTCPLFFFFANVLRLQPRDEPAEGLDARQLGNVYHRIFETLYQSPEVTDPTDLDQLVAALPVVAAGVLDEAPRREGFRETAWWTQTRTEIELNVRRSLEELHGVGQSFAPSRYEAAFGIGEEPALVLHDGADTLRLRGFIDRVDRDDAGRLRIIDYKSSGPYTFTSRAVQEGKKLQLPLYARAAEQALQLGRVADGFYWHVRHAEASPFTLGGFEGGPEAAMDIAAEKAWEAVRQARRGHFVPRKPDDGCPSYCPAAGFCWRYERGYGG